MKKILDVIISVDWEGISLDHTNLKSLSDFKNFWNIPLTHYFSPAYWTHPQILNQGIDQSHIEEIFRDNEVGLHIHTPQHFIEKLGLPLRLKPTFALSGDQHEHYLKGQEVMLLAYSRDEFRKILLESLKMFDQHHIPRPRSFRAGGWMISPEQLHELQDLGFEIDSSAVPPDFFKKTSWQNENLHRYAQLLWSEITDQTTPYWALPSLLEIPNNLGAIDYWTLENINTLVTENLNQAYQKNRHLFVITAHQETFADQREKIEIFFECLSRQNDYHVNFVNHHDVKKIWGQKPEAIRPQVYPSLLF